MTGFGAGAIDLALNRCVFIRISAIFDFAIADGRAYAVTELLDGETLLARLGNHPFPWRKAVDMATIFRAWPRRRTRQGHHPPGPETRERLRPE